jgi:hypothetical protein
LAPLLNACIATNIESSCYCSDVFDFGFGCHVPMGSSVWPFCLLHTPPPKKSNMQ